MHKPTSQLPPSPAAWREGSIVLSRQADGTLAGQVCLDQARWYIRNWRRGGDAEHVLFEVQPVSDPEFEAFQNKLGKMFTA